MKPDKGVFKRKGSDVWQHRVYIPKDLQPSTAARRRCRQVASNARLREANRLARLRLAEYEQEFEAKRAAQGSQTASAGSSPLFNTTSEVIERLAAGHAAKLVEQDFAHRAETFARATADPSAFWRGEIISAPDDWKSLNGHPYSYWSYLTEDTETPLETGLAYALQAEREARLATLKQAYAIGNIGVLAREAEASSSL